MTQVQSIQKNVMRKLVLNEGSWLEQYPGWLKDPQQLMKMVISAQPPREPNCIILNWYGWGFEPDSDYQRPVKYAWPSYIKAVKKRLEAQVGMRFNSCQVNHYLSGKEGAGWHTDFNQLVKIDPTIVSISMGGDRKMLFRPLPKSSPNVLNMQYKPARQSEATKSVTLKSGDLLVMKGRTQDDWEHAIANARDQAQRLVLIFRRYL